MRQRILASLLLLCCTPLSAQVYTYIDAEGNRVFTDKPRTSQAQRIELKPSPAVPISPPQPARLGIPAPPPQPLAEVAAPAYALLRILLPQVDASISHAGGEILVTVQSDPTLQEGHQYRVLLDGQPYGEPGRSAAIVLNNVDRGSHMLAVEIIDAAGKTLERTPAQPLHMQRISLAQKRRVNPCQKADYGVRPECPLKDKPVEPRKLLPFL